MDGEPSKSWDKLFNFTNETFLKIFKDKVTINNYKEVGETLKKEIVLMKEQSEHYSKANETLENQLKHLKESYERKVQDLPFYSNVCARLKKQLADSEQRYRERETYLKGVIDSEEKKYDDLVDKSDAVWPECQQLKQERVDLAKMQFDLKFLLQRIEDERSKIRMKRDVHQKMFNGTIVDFVMRIKEQQENQRVIEEIERYTKDGNLLLKEYEKALAYSEKRKMNEEFSQYDKMLKFSKDDLAQIYKKHTLSATSSTSSLLNLSTSKVVPNNAALEKYKERELERKRRLQELMKHNLLYKQPPPPWPKPQPPPEKTPTGKVQVLSQVFMPPAVNPIGKIESKPGPREAKMPRFNSDSPEVKRGFSKPQDVGGFTTLMQNKKRTPCADEKLKGGQPQNTPFGGFAQAAKKEQQKPQKEKAAEEPELGVGPVQKASFSGEERPFEKEKSSSFSQPKPEQKKAPYPFKNISGDEVFKMPKTIELSFDSNPLNQEALVDENTITIRKSIDSPMCLFPSIENNEKSQLMF